MFIVSTDIVASREVMLAVAFILTFSKPLNCRVVKSLTIEMGRFGEFMKFRRVTKNCACQETACSKIIDTIYSLLIYI